MDNFVISCDMPLISSDLIKFILSVKNDFEIVVPKFKGFHEPLCAYYHKSVVPGFLKAIENQIYKIQEVAGHFRTKYVEIEPGFPFYHEHLFANINSRNDLEKIRTIMKIDKNLR
jgi:molybdopterin-guanine dinucleotide biosynthesis protein A